MSIRDVLKIGWGPDPSSKHGVLLKQMECSCA